jgi:hypothetical protein
MITILCGNVSIVIPKRPIVHFLSGTSCIGFLCLPLYNPIDEIIPDFDFVPVGEFVHVQSGTGYQELPHG